MPDDEPSDEEKRAREYQAHRDYLEVTDPDENRELNDSVRVRVNSTTKRMWEDYASNLEGVGNLSALIRMAVAKEMTGGFEGEEQTQEQILEAVLEIKNDVEQAQQQIAETHSEIIDEDKLQVTLEQAIDASMDAE